MNCHSVFNCVGHNHKLTDNRLIKETVLKYINEAEFKELFTIAALEKIETVTSSAIAATSSAIKASLDARNAVNDLTAQTIDFVNDAINNTAVEGGVLADTFVTVTANGSGSIARNQRNKNSDIVNAKDFGAKGDGSDSTFSLQAAIDSLASVGGVVRVSKGDYLLKGVLKIRNSNITLQGETGAVIHLDPSMTTGVKEAVWAIDVYQDNSKLKSLLTVSSNGLKAGFLASQGDVWVQVNDANEVVTGDLVYIIGDFSTSPWTSQNRDSATKGETNLVIDVDYTNNKIRLIKGLSDNWASNELVTLQAITPLKNVKVKDIHVVSGDSNIFRGIRLGRCFGGTVVGCTVEGMGVTAVESRESFMNFIIDNGVNESWAGDVSVSDNATTGLAYGIRTVNDTATQLTRNRIHHARHTIDISGSYPSRLCTIENNTCTQLTEEYGNISTHGAAEGCTFRGNTVIGGKFGFVIRGENMEIYGNTVRDTGVSVYMLQGRNVRIFNNTMDGQVRLTPSDSNHITNYTVVKNNIFRNTTSPVTLVDLDDSAFTDIYNLQVDDNTVYSTTSTTTTLINSVYSVGAVLKGTLSARNNILHVIGGAGKKYLFADEAKVTIDRWCTVSNDSITQVNAPSSGVVGDSVFLKDAKKPTWWDGTKWVEASGVISGTRTAGTTANRPTGLPVGFVYFDTDLGKPVWWRGTKWVFSDGADA